MSFYTKEPTHLRIFSDSRVNDNPSREWFVDGANDVGNYTEMCWSYDSFEDAVNDLADFVNTSTTAGGVAWKWRTP